MLYANENLSLLSEQHIETSRMNEWFYKYSQRGDGRRTYQILQKLYKNLLVLIGFHRIIPVPIKQLNLAHCVE